MAHNKTVGKIDVGESQHEHASSEKEMKDEFSEP
jgi:hypothetical protein